MILPVCLLGCLLATTGCDEVKRLKAANQVLSERNDALKGEKMQLQAEKDRLRNELAKIRGGQDASSRRKDLELAELRADNNRKTKALADFKKMYDKLMNEKTGRGPLPVALTGALRNFAANNPGLAEFDEKNGMVKLKSDLTFPPGESRVNVKAADSLAKLVAILNSPTAKSFSVYVAGHTDNMPISKPTTKRKHPTNWYLSVHRAIGVQKVLEKAGLAPARIAAMGFGEYHPVAPNKRGKKGNAKNRRVEIWIVPAGSFLTPEAQLTR